MRWTRLLLLFCGSLLAAVVLFRPAPWLSMRHVESDDPQLLTEAAAGALWQMREPELDRPLRPDERRLAERFYRIHRRLVSLGPAAVDPLMTVVVDQNVDVSDWAEGALAQLGKPSVPRLREWLDHGDPGVRRAALVTLSGHPLEPVTIHAVTRLLSDPDGRYLAQDYFQDRIGGDYWGGFARSDPSDLSPEESVAVARAVRDAADLGTVPALGRCRPEDAVPLLFEMCLRGGAEMDEMVMEILDRLDPEGVGFDPDPSLLEGLLERHPRILAHVRDPRAREAVARALSSPEESTRYRAVRAMRTHSSTIAQQLIPALADEDTEVVRAALRAIKDRRWNDAYDAVRAVSGRDRKLEPEVWETLAELDAVRVQPELVALAQDVRADPAVRLVAVRHLADEAALRLLVQDPEPPIRLTALRRLVEGKAADLGPLLAERIQNDLYQYLPGTYQIRAAAVYAAGAARVKELLPVLIQIVEGTPSEGRPSDVGVVAVTALGILGDPAAIPPLQALAARNNSVEVVLSRARLGDKSVAEGLEVMLHNGWSAGRMSFNAVAGSTYETWEPLSGVRGDLLEASWSREYAERLAGFGEIDRLLGLLKLPVEEAQPYVLLGLAVSKDPRAWEPLAAGLREKGHLRLRRAAAEGLGTFGDSRAVPLLVAAMDDPSPWVRAASAIALQKLTSRDFGMPATVAEAFKEKRPRFDPAALREHVRAALAAP